MILGPSDPKARGVQSGRGRTRGPAAWPRQGDSDAGAEMGRAVSRVVVVTGASSGIGLGSAVAFAGASDQVVVALRGPIASGDSCRRRYRCGHRALPAGAVLNGRSQPPASHRRAFVDLV